MRTQIHVDEYKMGLFKAVAHAGGNIPSQEGAALCGFKLGNHYHDGCLSEDSSTRLHSCDRNMGCEVFNSPKTVYIIPGVTMDTNGQIIRELGAGGGLGDLKDIAELDFSNEQESTTLLDLLCEQLSDRESRQQTMQLIINARTLKDKRLSLEKVSYTLNQVNELPLNAVAQLLENVAKHQLEMLPAPTSAAKSLSQELPNEIVGSHTTCFHA